MPATTIPAILPASPSAPAAPRRHPGLVHREWVLAYAKARAEESDEAAVRHYARTDRLEAELLDAPHSPQRAWALLSIALRLMADEGDPEPAYAPHLYAALASLTAYAVPGAHAGRATWQPGQRPPAAP